MAATARRVLLCLALAMLFISPFFCGVSAAITDDEDHIDDKTGLAFTHEFPKNPFNIIKAGEPTEIHFKVANKGELNQTIVAVSGVLSHPQNVSIVLRNLTAQRYKTLVTPNEEVTVPFIFVVETDPGEHAMAVFADVLDQDGKAHRAIAFTGTVTIAENDSMFDLQSISIYLMGLAAAAGVGYLAYESFLGGKKSGKARRVKPVVVVKPNVNPGEPDMEWIPEHLVKQVDAAKRRSMRIKKKPTKKDSL